MRRVAFALPEMALTDHASTRLRMALEASGGQWFCAEDGATPWPARVGNSSAYPVADKPGLSAFSPHEGAQALCLQTGVNGGYGWSDTMPEPNSWSAALIWASGKKPARALLSLRGEGGGNYLYLHETPERQIELRDNDGTAIVTGPECDEGWQITLISSTEGEIKLAAPGGEVLSAPAPDDLPRDGALLLGCRSHRPGLKKTLGAGRIRDLFIWPGRDILAETSEAGGEMRAAFDHFCLWER
ncbi:MAG: hypothetical protein P8X43_04430 [Maritimibacter sp.]